MKKPPFFQYVISNIVDNGIDKIRLFTEKVGVNSTLAKISNNKQLERWKMWIYGLFFLALASLYLSFFSMFSIFQTTALVSEGLLIGSFLIICIRNPVHGLYLFALALPIITYRPLLAFILILYVVLFIYQLDYEQVKENIKNHLNFAVLVFCVFLFVTTIVSVHWTESLSHFILYNLASFLLYLLLIVYINKREILSTFIQCLIISTALISLYGIYQYLTLETTAAHWIDLSQNPDITKRIYSTFGNPNIFSQYLIMILPFNFVYILYTKTWRNKIIYSLLFIISMLALVLTFSRGGWLAIVVALAILVSLISWRLLLVGGIVAAIGVNFLPDSIIGRFTSIFNPTADSSSSYRLQMWESAFDIIEDYWFTGIGSDPTTFFNVYADYMLPDVRIFHFHNIYLMTFVTGGILLFGALVYLFYLALRTSTVTMFMNRNLAKDPLLSYLSKAAFVAFIAIAIAGMTEDIWRQYRVEFLFWMVVGIISVAYNLVRKLDHPKEETKP